MSNLSWITLNNRLKNGIHYINKISKKKFEGLLAHIISSDSDEYFTAKELQKLQDTLKLDESQLQLLLQSISHVLKQSSKVIVKPTELQKQLTEVLGLDEEKANIFVKEWSKETKKDIGEFGCRQKLENINWEINVQTSSDLGGKQVIPNARLQFDLSEADDCSKTNKLIMELSEDDLQQLYSTLEVIQLRLDNISKT